MTWEVIGRGTVTGIERHCVLKPVIAECDGCRDQYLGGDVWNSRAANEDELRSDGWLVLGDNRHICPSCIARPRDMLLT